jgi:hypothetical protein
MKRPDQSHLHSKLKYPELACPGRARVSNSAVRGKHLRKEQSEQLVIHYSETCIFLFNFLLNICLVDDDSGLPAIGSVC